ncbi:J domain-containing protein [Adhaeribacter radiodurans]|uniref:DnaJ domain-containing protein n=1 Tax=Adhaeribacter radiodurans TaxID=2745197 RepID=A0A7L7LF72_9BACT|nr:DnaJ domain-containing protein [Adhaeribacter radiodurans]QMU31019.1 DnaJ domain-containing protein [Adhaeribacter radiodurans]
MNQNYYTILEVNPSATAAEIKAAYKRLARQYHPDKHQGNQLFEEKFKIVNEAYQVLSDERKRALYDLRLRYMVLQLQAMQQAQYQAPIVTREPASYAERHYRNIPKREFQRKDIKIIIGIFIGIIIASLLVKLLMDHITGMSNYRAALQYTKTEQWSLAHSLLTKTIYFKPNFVDAYSRRARIEMNVYQNYPAAISDFNEAIKRTKQPSADLFYDKGRCYEKLRRDTLAETQMTKALQANQVFTPAYFERGMIRATLLNTYPQAIQDFDSFLKFPGTNAKMRNEALLYRGYCYYLLGKPDKSIPDYEQALTMDSQSGRLLYLLGKAYYDLDRKDEACTNFLKAYKRGYGSAAYDLYQYCKINVD